MYSQDFYQWTENQISLLKERDFSKLDINHIIEEMESLGNSERNAIESYMIVLFIHLLKIEFQPSRRCKSWDNSVENAKFRIRRLMEKNPSLKRKLIDCIDDAYYSARLQASSETGLEVEDFWEDCPWEAKELFPFQFPK